MCTGPAVRSVLDSTKEEKKPSLFFLIQEQLTGTQFTKRSLIARKAIKTERETNNLKMNRFTYKYTKIHVYAQNDCSKHFRLPVIFSAHYFQNCCFNADSKSLIVLGMNPDSLHAFSSSFFLTDLVFFIVILC